MTNINEPKQPGTSSRVIFAVVVGIILLGLIVWAKGHNSNVVNSTATSSEIVATPIATSKAVTHNAVATPKPTPTPSAVSNAYTFDVTSTDQYISYTITRYCDGHNLMYFMNEGSTGHDQMQVFYNVQQCGGNNQ